MARKIAIVDGHPDPDGARLCHALAEAYATGAREAGHEIRRIDVARLDFPILRSQSEFETGSVAPDIEAAQRSIGWADGPPSPDFSN